VVAAKELIPTLGRLVAINGLWTMFKPSQYFDPPTEWRRSDSGGPVSINLIHDIDILHHLFGAITRVYAERTLSQRDYLAEEGAAVTLRFANGMIGTFLLSDAVVSPHNFEAGTGENPMIPKVGQDFYRIFGSEGTLSIPDLTRWVYDDGKKSWNEPLQSKTFAAPKLKTPFELQIEHFVKVIRGDEVPSCSGLEGLRAVAVSEAIKASMRTSQPIDVNMEVKQ
jgi:predicted dehydrogenase